MVPTILIHPFLIVGMIKPMRKKQFNIHPALLTAVLLISCGTGADLSESTLSTLEASPTASGSLIPTSTPAQDISLLPDDIPAGVEVVFWHPWSGKMANLVNEMIDEFNDANQWGISIQPFAFSDEQVLMQQVADARDLGEPLPDLFAAPDFFLASLVEDGIELRDQEEYLTSSVWGIPQADLERFFPVFLDSGLYEGKRIGFPAYRTGHFLFYNRSWAEELGFSQIPENPEAFEEQVCASARSNQFGPVRENIGTGGWVYSLDSSAFLSWLKAFEGGVNDPSGNISNLQGSGNIESSSYLYDLFLPANNCAWLGRQPLPYQYFANRQAISYSGIMEDILIQEQVNELNNTVDDWTIVPYPSVSGRPVVTVSGISYGIVSSNEGKSLAAWEFIKWMTTTENQVRIVETTASFPLSATALNALVEFRAAHPAWSDGLVYLPFVEHIPFSTEWIVVRDILSDISWQLIQFTTSRDNIPGIWENADTLLQEISVN
jgi:ABC-type glycerol-3-phosphate transport system substrate-binding protein